MDRAKLLVLNTNKNDPALPYLQLGAMARHFPMFVLPVQAVHDIEERLPHHEDICDKLVEWQPGMGPVVFISQTWLTGAHPDDDKNSKLVLLKALLRRAAAGELEILPHGGAKFTYGKKALAVDKKVIKNLGRSGFVWFDIFSVPQRDGERQAKAISSISSYISDSAVFMVLAPGGVVHESGRASDLSAWASRGWCRVEQISNVLAPKPRPNPLVIATSPTDVTTHGPGGMLCKDWTAHRVGDGAFTVASDILSLGPGLHSLIEARKAHGKAEGTETGIMWFRMLHACQAWLLHNTGTVVAEAASLDEWMEQMGFADVNEGAAAGWTPLRFAVQANRLDLVEALIDRGADTQVVIKKKMPEFGGAAGQTLLHATCMNHDNADMVRLLLTKGQVDPHRGDKGQKARPMVWAMAHGRIAAADALIAHDETLGRIGNGFGMTAVSFSVETGCVEMVRHVLATYPHLMPKDGSGTGHPGNFVAWSTNPLGSLVVTKLLLEEGFRHDVVNPIESVFFRRLLGAADLTFRLSRRPGNMLDQVVLGFRATALHSAAVAGNRLAIKLLLEHDANPASTTNPLRQTPLIVANIVGYEAICLMLLEAGAPPAAKDKRGRTARDWARRRGHDHIVRLDEWQRGRELEPSSGSAAAAPAGKAPWGKAKYQVAPEPETTSTK